MTTITDRYGNVQNLHFDGPGRVLFIEQNNIDNNLVDTFFEMKRNEYDAMGRKYKTVTTDFIDPLNDPKNITQLETTTQYDSWGQPYLSQVSSGQNQYQTNDPVNMTSTSWFCATCDTTQEMGKVCTQYNIQKLPTSVTQIDINGNSKGSLTKTYDGLGRLRSSTDELNHTTSWTYDPFSRVSTQTLPDSTVVTRTYAPQSGAPLDKTISVTASDGTQYPLLGEQTFDGLGRLLTTTCGGRTTTCTYDDTFDMPLTVTDNLNQTLTYQYIPELGNALEHVTGQQLFQSFTFDPASAELQSDEEVGGQATVSGWYPSSRSQYQTVTSTTGAERTASYSWTLAGNLLTYQDVTGNLQTITPDEFGRLYTVGDDEVLLTMGWRDDGRFDHQVAKDLTNQSTLTTTIIPDDFNREGIRQLDASDGSSVSIVTTYYDNDQVETITVSRDGVTLRKEHFYYDSRNRLQTYSCSGTSLPVDGYGQEIVSQVFTMDVINNIQTCVTTTPDGLVDTATFIYGNPDDPTQLTSITHSGNDSYPASITLHYDDNGRMTLDEAGRILTYDEAGRLSTVTPVAGSPCSYGYDAHNTLVLQSLADDDTRLLYYAGSKLVNEIQVEKNQYSRMRQGMSGSAAVSEGELSS
jgi:YD repeat-containing protein